ncbi:hypothetical protein G6K88_17375 [Agrobacterium rhizogenes]|uniref:hypothetical protein n=1 Tax=Rhizobium rhizogenes TaxID=359 RepID=UPI0013967A13|nr:hypothetical protein [Rhizobium rhizogenes]NTG02068.1 hypothetical protein [Rhizobium rhizogenes]NTG15416.1 hypothetical protein [Rhizobium rhizogenes]NTG22296.1 hypothetical protein [Rhizobium rhizogenes]NTG35976.1 hypothetical protein [Rhizobium rhizogenes]NTG55226.1 hypothetical protein [Rhizobium rhizogenes]
MDGFLNDAFLGVLGIAQAIPEPQPMPPSRSVAGRTLSAVKLVLSWVKLGRAPAFVL